MRAQEFIIKGNVQEAIAPGIDTVASVKKLWQYANRNLIDLTSMASFENEHKKQPYVEDRLVNLLKTADGKPVTIAFDMNGSLEFENNVLYIPIGIMWKYRGIISGPEFVKKVVNFLSNQSGMTEGATVTRIDSKPVTDFASGLKAYKHTDDWSQSGLDTGDDSYWKNKNLKTNTTKGLFAGDPRRTALYATGNAHETRYVEFTQNGQSVVYFDQKDLPAMRSRKTYLTVFDASDFRQLPTGEWFSENPGKPIKQVPIGDPFKYIASQGWIVRVTDDLDKVFKQVKNMHKAGKIAQYGAEGMNESKQGVAEGLRVDVPNEDWLDDAIAYAKQKSPDRNGLPYMGKTTATVRKVEVPVNLLKRIPGMRNEQQNVRQHDLAAIEKIMKDTGKLPIHAHSNEEYKPFINVAYDGSAWVNEGNHRIMAAYRLGWPSLPVEISYFDGGERVESGPMYPGKIGL